MCTLNWRREKKIKTVEELLDAMYSEQWNVSAELKWIKRWPDNCPYVIIFHDRNYYVDADQIEVLLHVAQQAYDEGLITGVPNWGYTSTSEWRLSEEGKYKAMMVRRRAREAKKEIKVNYDHDGEG